MPLQHLSVLVLTFLLSQVSGSAVLPDSCKASSVSAAYAAGLLTLDGQSTDWNNVKPKDGMGILVYNTSNMEDSVEIFFRAAHDGVRMYYLLEFPGKYHYKANTSTSAAGPSPTVMLAFRIGLDATMMDLGGCRTTAKDQCSAQFCRGREVDLIRFSFAGTVPGRVYSSAAPSSTSSLRPLRDGFAFSDQCRHLDNTPVPTAGPGSCPDPTTAWEAAWGHSSLSTPIGGFAQSDAPFGEDGVDGTYTVEFRRQYRTADTLREDIQFTADQGQLVGAGLWCGPEEWPQHRKLACEWNGVEPKPPLFSISTIYHITANTVLATVLSFVSIACTILVCIYMKYYIMHVRREFFYRQNLEMGHKEHDETTDTPPSENP